MSDPIGTGPLRHPLGRRQFMTALAGGILAAPLAAEPEQAGKVDRVAALAGWRNPMRIGTPGLIVSLLILLVSLSQPAWSQEAKKPRVVMIAVTDESDKLAAPLIGAFRQTLHDAGYSEGRNIQIDIQYLAGRLERYPEVLTDTIQRGVDVIVVWAPTGAFAAKRAKTTIPIVFLAVPNPVENGLISNLTRPGATSLSWTSPEDLAKCLQLLREAAPKAVKVAVISSRGDPIASDTARYLEHPRER